jgi:predicted AAA+ superfamily ATPase
LLEHYYPELPSLTFDNKALLQQARDEPSSFFEYHAPPIFLDEIQYALELFPLIKMHLDKSRKKAQFFLTGSQSYDLMSNISESLAGRAGIMKMSGLSLREILVDDFHKPFLPTKEYLFERKKGMKKTSLNEIWHIIHRGSYPELYEKPDYSWASFYSDYVSTYIERDVRNLAHVGDELKFMRFMAVLAATTGQMINLNAVANEVGISHPTASRWLSILRTGGIVYLLEPYSNNAIKRTVKTPKLHFWDTGLAAYLTRWTTPEALREGNMSGHFFESFAVGEVLKSYINNGMQAQAFYYRDSNKREINLLIVENGTIHPLEIKKTADPDRKMINGFNALEGLHGTVRGDGGMICLADELRPLKGRDRAIPLWMV